MGMSQANRAPKEKRFSRLQEVLVVCHGWVRYSFGVVRSGQERKGQTQ